MEERKEERWVIKFSYNEDTMGNHKVFIVICFVLLLIAYLGCLYYWGFNALYTYVFLIFPVCIFYLWCRRWESRNEETERKNALALIDKHAKEDVQRLYGDEISISKLGYYFYTINDESCRCVLVYLSNNKTIRYDVNEIPSKKEHVCCCEIDPEPKETEERKLVRKISPHFRPLLYLSPLNELKIRILIIYAIGFAILAVGLITVNYFKWIPLVCIGGYIAITVLLAYISDKMKWLKPKAFFAKRRYNVIKILYFTVPAFELSLVLFFSLGIGLGIPCSILYCIENYTDLVLSKSVQYFICIALSTIILVHHDYIIHKYILSLLSKYDFEEPFIEVALNLTQGKNINFLIYMFYFLFISWTTLARLQGFDPLFSKELIEGATPAFLVHIAYTNMVIRFKDVDLKMDTMMDFMSKAYNIKILQLNLNDRK